MSSKTKAAGRGARNAGIASNRKPKPKPKPKPKQAPKRVAQHRGHGAMERHATPSAATTATNVPLPRDPKGGRAQFYQDPAIDQLWAVVTALTGEVSVAFDRLDTVERLLERDGSVSRAAIEAWRPDERAAAERAQRREDLIARVFLVLSQSRA